MIETVRVEYWQHNTLAVVQGPLGTEAMPLIYARNARTHKHRPDQRGEAKFKHAYAAESRQESSRFIGPREVVEWGGLL